MDTVTGLTPLLIDAKREYVAQLTDVLAPYVINYMQALYVGATQANRRTPMLTFQRQLREIQHWNANTIQQRTNEIKSRYAFLADLIAACFVAYVKILSSVKLHQNKHNITLPLPSNETFVHKVYVHTAREFYTNPALITSGDRATKVSIVRTAVETAVRDNLPIEDILKNFLGNTVDSANNTMNPAEIADEADVYSAGEQVQMMPLYQQVAVPQHVPAMPAAVHMPATQEFAPDQAHDFGPQVAAVPGFARAATAAAPGFGPAATAAALPDFDPAPTAAAVADQGPALFGAQVDAAPKQISMGAAQAPYQPQAQAQVPYQPQAQAQDLFSDAEDEF